LVVLEITDKEAMVKLQIVRVFLRRCSTGGPLPRICTNSEKVKDRGIYIS
jgi:hypothetical protein